MNEFQKELAKDLIQNVTDASTTASTLSAFCGDVDFALMAMVLDVLLHAKSKGDMPDIARAVIKVVTQKNAEATGGSAIEDIINTMEAGIN